MKNTNLLSLALLLSLMFVSCKQDSSSSNQAGQDDKVEDITIAMVTFPGYAPLYVAKEKGLFEGVNVDLRRIEDIGQMRGAIMSGQIDVYAATYDIFQAIKGQKPPGVGFLAMDESHGGDGIAVAGEINSIADFKGKKVAAEPGFPPYFILQYLLAQADMSLKDVDFQDLASQDAGNAFVTKQFDIVGTYEPYLSISADKREGAKVLYSSKDTEGLVVDWLFANSEVVDTKPEALKAIAKGWFAALDFIESNPEEAYQIMGDAFGVSSDEMQDFKTGITWLDLASNKGMFKPGDKNAYAIFKEVGDVLERNDETDTRVEAKDHLTDKIVRDL